MRPHCGLLWTMPGAVLEELRTDQTARFDRTAVSSSWTRSVGWAPGGGNVTFYEHSNFSGWTINATGFNSWVGRDRNDRISAVSINPSSTYRAEAYEHINYGGWTAGWNSSGWYGRWASGSWGDAISSYKVWGVVKEQFQNYRYNWTSTWNPIFDDRISLGYQVTTQEKDIFDFRPVYETSVRMVPVVQFEDVTVWETVPIVQSEFITRTEQTIKVIPLLGADYGGESLYADSILIESRGSTTLSGLAHASTDFTVNSGLALTVNAMRDGDGQPVMSALTAGGALTLTSTDLLRVADAAELAAERISLESSTSNVIVNGQIGQEADEDKGVDTLSISVTARGDISLGGQWTAENSMAIKAGQGSGGFGGVSVMNTASADIPADLDLAVRATDGSLLIEAGQFGGNIRLATETQNTRSMINVGTQGSDSTVTLTAADGRILLEQGVLVADTLTTRAGGDTALSTRVSTVDMRIAGVGNLKLDNRGSLQIDQLQTADGAIVVSNVGSVIVGRPGVADGNIRTLGGSERNSITLNVSRATPSDEVSLSVLQDIDAGNRGNLTLNVQGDVNIDEDALLTANRLDIAQSGENDLVLKTHVNVLAMTLQQAGNVTVSQGNRDISVTDTQLANGWLSINAMAAVNLDDVRLNSNIQGNDITVLAAGNITVGSAVAGVYLKPIGGTTTLVEGQQISARQASDAAARTINLAGVEVVTGGDYRLTISYGTGATAGTAVIRYTAKAGDTLDDIAEALAHRISEFTTGLGTAAAAQPFAAIASGAELTVTGAGTSTITAFDRVTSAGVINLTSTAGAISRAVGSGDINLVANRLNLTAASGILNLQVAATYLDAVTTSGDIRVSDYDAGFQMHEGLFVVRAVTAKGTGATNNTVAIRSQNDLKVGRVANAENDAINAVLRGNTLRLESDQGSVQVLRHENGYASLDFDKGFAFRGSVLDLYRFFEGTELTEYRARDAFLFREEQDGTAIPGGSGALPGNITSNTIIIDTGALLSLGGTLTATERIELRSDRDVLFNGTIAHKNGAGNQIGSFVVEARGLKTVTVVVDTNNAGQGNVSTTSRSSGFVDINVAQLPVDRLDLRAKENVVLRVNSSGLTLRGFIGGIAGFDRANNVELDVFGTLSLTGGIVAANQTLDVRANAIDLDGASVFIASDLLLQSAGAIRANTLTNTLRAQTTALNGHIVINEATNLEVLSAIAANGRVEISTGGELRVHEALTLVDRAGNDIKLEAAGQLLVARAEAAVSAGAEKLNGRVIVDSPVGIEQMMTPVLDADGNPTATLAYNNAATVLYGREVVLRGNVPFGYVLLQSATDVGVDRGLQIRTTSVGTGILREATQVSENTLASAGGALVSVDVTADTTQAGQSSVQISEIAFLVEPRATMTFTVELGISDANKTSYTVQVGDTVNGELVTESWASILGAFEHLINADSGAHKPDVSIEIIEAFSVLRFAASTPNTSFHLDSSIREEVFVVLGEPVADLVQSAGRSASQVAQVQFGPLQHGVDYAINLDGHTVSVRTGQNLDLLIAGLAINDVVGLEILARQNIEGLDSVDVGVAPVADTLRVFALDTGRAVTEGETYTLTITPPGDDPVPIDFVYVALENDTHEEVAAALADLVNDHAGYAATADANEIHITSGAGTSTISLSIDNAGDVTSSGTLRATTSISLGSLQVMNDGLYRILDGDTVIASVEATDGQSLADIATALAVALNTHAGTPLVAQARGAVIDLVGATGAVTVTASAVQPVDAPVHLTQSDAPRLNQRVVTFTNVPFLTMAGSGGAFLDEPVYRFTLGNQTFDISVSGHANLVALLSAAESHIDTDLAGLTATVRSENVAPNIEAVTQALASRINGEYMDYSASADSFDLDISGVINVPFDFSAENVTVNDPDDVIGDPLQPVIEAGPGVGQENRIVFADTSTRDVALQVVVGGVAYSVTAATVALTANQPGAPVFTNEDGATGFAEDMTVTFPSTLNAGHIVSVEVNGARFAVQAGADGVATNWNAVLGALAGQISTEFTGLIAASHDAASRSLTLSSVPDDTRQILMESIDASISQRQIAGFEALADALAVKLAGDSAIASASYDHGSGTLTLVGLNNQPFSLQRVVVGPGGAVANVIPELVSAGQERSQISELTLSTEQLAGNRFEIEINVDGGGDQSVTVDFVADNLGSLAGSLNAAFVTAGVPVTVTVNGADKLRLEGAVNTPFAVLSTQVSSRTEVDLDPGLAFAAPPSAPVQSAGADQAQVTALTVGGTFNADASYEVVIDGTLYSAKSGSLPAVLEALRDLINDAALAPGMVFADG